MEKIQEAVGMSPEISRGELSRKVCKWLDWRSPNGKLCEVSCRKALLEMDRQGVIKLPELKKEYSFHKRINKEPEEVEDVAEVNCSLRELGDIEIIAVPNRNSKLSQIWNNLMEKYHYLGSGPLCGAQIRYLIRSEYGWVGGLSFSGASYLIKARDKWIGWSEIAHHNNLQYIVSNSRFLIVPTVRVSNLASHILSKSAKQVRADWIERYKYTPILLETYVNPERFRGVSYRAANWINIGKTSGRRGSSKDTGEKDIYMYPLQSDWQSILCREPKIELGSRVRLEYPADWAEEEFGAIDFYDNRLKERLYKIARDFFSQPGELIPQASNGSIAKAKASYRFFSNKKVDMDKILKSHIEATAERIKEHDIVLAVQDTTTLNYTTHYETEGLGPISTTKDSAMGLILHDTLGFTTDGTPLGVLDVQCWARDPEDIGKKHRRKELPIEEKESMKWINSYRAVSEVQKLCSDTKIVSVGDREADIYDLFYEAVKGEGLPELLVRAERSRNRKVEGEHLWEKIIRESVSGYQEVSVPRRGARRGRIAKLEVRNSLVTLKPPVGSKLPPIDIWAVYAREIDYSKDLKEPLEWMLLTTVETSSFEEAIERLGWYVRRWGIEVYHRTLKSGCRIEDRQFDGADSIEACLAIDMVVTWRILFLTMMGRETPDVSCEVFLKEEEWKVLYTIAKQTTDIPEVPPTLREAVRMIASLGGFLGRKSDREPGVTTIWRGLQRLDDIVKFNSIIKSNPRAGT